MNGVVNMVSTWERPEPGGEVADHGDRTKLVALCRQLSETATRIDRLIGEAAGGSSTELFHLDRAGHAVHLALLDLEHCLALSLGDPTLDSGPRHGGMP